MQIKKIQRKIVVANALNIRLHELYNQIADLYDKYLSDEIKEYGIFISHVPSDGLCMHLNYDNGYILPLSILNEYLFENPDVVLDLETFTKLSI